MAVWERLRTHFGSNRRNLVKSHSNCANIKKAHSLLLYYPLLLVHFQMCKISEWPETLIRGLGLTILVGGLLLPSLFAM
jgi:hypothetical protein